MRLRLVHTLSLTLLAFAGVAVLALGGLTAWNLRNGFGSYLAARDVQHLGRFAGVVEAAAAREGGLQALQQGRLDLRELLDELKPPGLLGPTLLPQVVHRPGLTGSGSACRSWDWMAGCWQAGRCRLATAVRVR